ncbi:MAG: formate/nitrite transporter family protein [Longimicrobiales bacterium]|nr:formate/nitrite transporter family protein [Longimicrobiales bacterium]
MAEEVWQGLGELKRPAPGLLLSGLSAGLDIGFSVLVMGTVLTLLEPGASPLFQSFLLGNAYALGFIFVILGRSELFTEHTALAVFPVLEGRATLSELGRLWILVYLANLVGAAAFAAFAVLLGPRLGIVEVEAFRHIARALVDHDALTIFLSAVAAGWLVGLLSWLVSAARETVSQVVVVWIITFVMGFLGLHHCIVGSVEVLSGMFSGGGPSWSTFLHFLGWTTFGNVVGGVALVAMVKYSHAKLSE